MQLQIRKCQLSDLENLREISRRTFVDAFEKANNQDDFNSYVDTAFSKQTIESELRQHNSHFYFVYSNDELVAYFKFNEHEAQSELKESSGVEIQRIYVIGLYQGKRIGSFLMKEIEKLALKMNKRYLWLGVWERNLKAIEFYKRHGYHKIGTHPYLIGNDEQTDWLMRKDL